MDVTKLILDCSVYQAYFARKAVETHLVSRPVATV